MSPEPLPATPGHSALHDWLHIGGLGGALLLGAGTWAAVPPALEAAAGLSVVDGAWTAAFEDKLDAEAPHRALALPLWGAIEFFAFGDGRDGVVLAQDDLLFTDEELRLYPNEAQNTAESLRLILKARELLAQKNVQLVVALLPAKVRLHQGQLRTPWAPQAEARYAHALGALQAAGVVAPDLHAALAAKQAQGVEVFLRTDTHWTPAGAQAVAEELAAEIKARGLLPSAGGATYARTDGPEEPHEGDLLKYLPLGPLAHRGPAPDRLRPPAFALTSGGGGGGLLDEVSVPVALVGTSYSHNPRFGFAGALQVALGADVLNAAQEGKGPITPMARYLGDASLRESPPQVVIWEIPERYLPRADELATLPPPLGDEEPAR
jgi:alginate O-acetyltransferase complex protein AlgJ